MFKNRTAQIKIVKDTPPEFGTFPPTPTNFVTALDAAEAATHRILDHAVKAAVTIIVVQGFVRVLAK